MPPIILGEFPSDKRLRKFGVVPTTLGEQLGAVLDDPILQPALRLLPQEFEKLGEVKFEQQTDGLTPHERFRLASRGIQTAPEFVEPTDIEDPKTLEKDFPGVKFDRPTSRRRARVMARQHREETIREDIIARGPQGVVPTALGFGASLLASVIDPLNVASAFIPIYSQARFAGMVARRGVVQARLRRGVVEGAVGNALVEPAVFGLAKQQQLDYTMADSLLNVTIGGILGGGLHVAAGKIGDVVRAKTAATRAAALRASVAQFVEGRRVEVEDIMAADLGAPARSVDDAGPSGVRQATDEPVPDGETAVAVEREVDSTVGLTREEVEILLKEKSLSDRGKLVRALGSEEQADLFENLDRRRGSSNPKTADEASDEFDRLFGDTTPEQDRLIYGIGERAGLSEEELKDILRAINDTEFLGKSPDSEVASELMDGVRNIDPNKISEVRDGGGTGFQQAAFIRISRSMAELRRRGKSSEEIEEQVLDAAERVGFSREDAAEILDRVANATPERAVSQPALLSPEPIFEEPVLPPARSLAEVARSEADPRRDATADFEAADAIDANRTEAAKPMDEDLARAIVEDEERILTADLREQVSGNKELQRILDDADEAVKGIRAAADCLKRIG